MPPPKPRLGSVCRKSTLVPHICFGLCDGSTNSIPVIMVTAKGRPEDMAMARSLGAVEYITKPWADGDVELRVQWALAAVKEEHVG